MNIKKSLLIFIISFMVTVSVFAGRQENESAEVENLNSWQQDFDLEKRTKKNPVKYNIRITATDLGGNKTVEGPFNIFIDPESDKPVCGIINPYTNMRIVGNLNIVGTCVDDDGVAKVELILDEGKVNSKGESIEHTEIAKGTDFWSYYLDTTNLEEGPHTIKVIGYDINGLAGNPISIQWQLDRQQPVTAVENIGMGQLVSGNVTFTGVVSDGNGIKELYYSVDNGKFFAPVKIKNAKLPKGSTDLKNSKCDFTFSVDSRKFEDGAAVIWFKAIDDSGSIGYYSFLYFIDNTSPDVKIVYPADNVEVNGKFSIAGYARDTNGIKSLSWTFDDQKGDFELIPGNPYWSITLDTGKNNSKTKKFTIHAVDRAGNVVDVVKNFAFNAEKNMPVTTISQPVSGQVFAGDKKSVFVRGIAKGDVQISKVKIYLDGKEVAEQETRGAFYHEVCKAEDLSAGTHKITVKAINEDGITGRSETVEILSKGIAPKFDRNVVRSSKSSVSFEPGVEINPESGSSFEVTAVSQLGLTKIHKEVSCGNEVLTNVDLDLTNNETSYLFSVPVKPDSLKGVYSVLFTATDILGRTTEYKSFFKVRDTSRIYSKDLAVVFDDSIFTEVDGVLEVESNPEFPISGYLIGADAVSVELSPSTPFATAKLNGNRVIITPTNAVGRSAPITVKVRTNKNNKVVESKKIIFKNDNVLPVFKGISVSGSTLADPEADAESYKVSSINSDKPVTINGTVTCQTGVGSLRYRVIQAKAELNEVNNVITKLTTEVPKDYTAVTVNSRNGSFSITVNPEDFGPGEYLVELVAESAGGNKAARVVGIKNLPETGLDSKGNQIAPKAYVNWFEGVDLYCLATYQGEMGDNITVFPRSAMKEGANFKEVTLPIGGKPYLSPKVIKDTKVNAVLAMIGEEKYEAGLPLVMTMGTPREAAVKAKIYIDTTATVSYVNYEVSGEKVAGGEEKMTGAAILTKSPDVPNRWIAEIPLYNLPNRVTNIKATIKSSSFSDKEVRGTIFVVRPATGDSVDTEGVYVYPSSETIYDKVDNNYIIQNDSKIYYYINVESSFRAELVSAGDGLEIETKDNVAILSAPKEGNYRNVRIRVTDATGRVFDSKPINVLADSKGPVLAAESQSPKLHDWVRKSITLQGAAQDELGVRSVEYSFNNGETWEKFSISGGRGGSQGVTFSKTVDISNFEDGLVEVDFRATDNAGHETFYRTAVYKDTVAPDVKVVEPLKDDVINGENLVVFEAKDNVTLAKAEYVNTGVRSDMVMEPLVTTHIGTNDKPNNSRMSFVFSDGAGNTTTVNSYDFSIDSKSDLPISQIHIPEEMQVLTRDFIVSGVVIDDDGDSTIYYKVDNGPYKQVAINEVYGTTNPEAQYKMDSCFEIRIPISEMTDNEHSVTIYAVDVNGVKGEEITRKFRISLEEPKGSVEKPTIENAIKGVVEISGTASDKNGIEKVEISLDNGSSYNDATGTTNWVYKVDSRAIPGGTSAVFLRITDKYGITGLYSSLINIDNEAPTISLQLPLDDSTSTGKLFFSGYAKDNVEISKMYVTIRNMDRTSQSIVRNLKVDRVIGETLDVSDLPNGFYNIELTGEDRAGNRTNVSRNIHIDKTKTVAQVDVLYPLNGEHKNGYFNIYGQITEPADDENNHVEKLKLYVDNKLVKETEPTISGFYKFEINPPSTENTEEYDETGAAIKVEKADMTDGVHTYRIDAVLNNGAQISSREQTITYSKVGTWLTLDNFTYGDFAKDRPYLRGRAGYYPSAEEEIRMRSKDISKEEKTAYENKKTVDKIEISFDNGKTFQQISNTNKWMYRVENQDLPEGYHFMLVRVTMKSGDTAIERSIIQIDNTNPTVKLITPGRGGSYNQILEVSGLSNDDVGLDSVLIDLRKGDKSAYEVPAFIQGLYLDFHFWGATLYDIGAGLTFFDDNVKLQAQWGQFTQAQRDAANKLLGREPSDMRYGGDSVFGFKLLANVATVPFSYFLGRDWEWLYANFALGAQFSRFNETSSGKPQWLSSVVGQIEFPRIQRKDASFLSAFSFYTEGSLWFIPTDVAGDNINSMVFQMSVGLRANIF